MNNLAFIGLLLLFGVESVAGQTVAPRELRGDGSWKTDGELKRSAQQWSLDLQRADDGTVSGLITVTDSPLFQAGRVRGKFEGRTIYGTITDEQGEHVARFNGVLSDQGFRGKYTDRTGETGEWEWEGRLPE